MISNPINISGNILEDKIENFLISKGIPYERNKHNGIDFIINNELYIDAKNQNTGGSVDEKLPFTVWKYKNKYKINHMIIVHGEHNISKKVLQCIEEMSDIKVDFYDFHYFCAMMEGQDMRGSLESCMS